MIFLNFSEYDFGAFQLQTVSDNPVVKKSLFLSLTHFGDHALHHLFPTVDQAELPYISDILEETCKEFKIQLKFTKSFNAITEQILQLKRTVPNQFFNKKIN